MPFSELYFNVDNGYLEGLVRGFKAGILSQADYLNLVQCETLEGESNVCWLLADLQAVRFHLRYFQIQLRVVIDIHCRLKMQTQIV